MNADERSKRIAEHSDKTPQRVRLWCKGQHRYFDVIRVEVEALLLNPDNRRFHAEKLLMETKLGHSLDPESSSDDELSVVSILLDSSLHVEGNRVVGKASNDYEGLKKDWLARGQETPFWIRPDGTVRNGNRRLAMIKRLRQESGGDAHGWVEAVVLGPEIDEDDLFAMEQREQLTEDFKERYTNVNLLLSLREAAELKNIDWADNADIERVAGVLQWLTNGDKKYAIKQLGAIKYMDAYLRDSEAEGQYHKLLRQVERFRDVGWVMGKMEGYPDSQQDMLRLCFAAVRASNTHAQIRKLWDIFLNDRVRYDTLLSGVASDEAEWETAQSKDLPEPDISRELDEDDEDDEPPVPTSPNYPKEKVGTRVENAVDGYLAKDRGASQILAQALDRLVSLTNPEDRIRLALAADDTGQVRDLLNAIYAWAEAAKTRYD
ncbi:MAG TPA: hypothetical protein VEL28_04785 [Candidatus Binatia bacterium]|nr:hypothetical protein [Candidatus Binatia bacterium]